MDFKLSEGERNVPENFIPSSPILPIYYLGQSHSHKIVQLCVKMVWAGSLGIYRLDTLALVAKDVSYHMVLQALGEGDVTAKVAAVALLEVGVRPVHGLVQ